MADELTVGSVKGGLALMADRPTIGPGLIFYCAQSARLPRMPRDGAEHAGHSRLCVPVESSRQAFL